MASSDSEMQRVEKKSQPLLMAMQRWMMMKTEKQAAGGLESRQGESSLFRWASESMVNLMKETMIFALHCCWWWRGKAHCSTVEEDTDPMAAGKMTQSCGQGRGDACLTSCGGGEADETTRRER